MDNLFEDASVQDNKVSTEHIALITLIGLLWFKISHLWKALMKVLILRRKLIYLHVFHLYYRSVKYSMVRRVSS